MYNMLLETRLQIFTRHIPGSEHARSSSGARWNNVRRVCEEVISDQNNLNLVILVES